MICWDLRIVSLEMVIMRYELKGNFIVDNEAYVGDKNSIIDIKDKNKLLKILNENDRKQKLKIKELEEVNEYLYFKLTNLTFNFINILKIKER